MKKGTKQSSAKNTDNQVFINNFKPDSSKPVERTALSKTKKDFKVTIRPALEKFTNKFIEDTFGRGTNDPNQFSEHSPNSLDQNEANKSLIRPWEDRKKRSTKSQISVLRTPGGNAIVANQPLQPKFVEKGAPLVSISKNTQIYLDLLEKKYKVPVEVLETNAKFYSEETFHRTVIEKIYFLSNENPNETFMVTESLIRQANIRYELMHASRVEKTSLNAENHLNFIEIIRSEYKASHNGQNPSDNMVARILNERKIESPRGKDAKWHSKSVRRVLDRKPNDATPDRT